MRNRPIHQNLDTSFVNLSALIKYLRRRQFIGNVKVQLNGYMADIHILKDNQMKVSEHDQISGRVSEGEEAFQRILIRAREAGGTINVYQLVEMQGEIKVEKPVQKQANAKSKTAQKTKSEDILDAVIIEPIPKPTDKSIYQNGNSNGHSKNITKQIPVQEKKSAKPKTERKVPQTKRTEPIVNKVSEKETSNKPLPDFPFALTNEVESLAKKNKISSKDWQILLKLKAELLGTIDRSLAKEKLDFAAAFKKACGEISDDYPFLNPNSDIFAYSNGTIKMTEQVRPKIFIVSIIEVLRRVLDKLASHEKFENIHRSTVQTLIALMNKRKPYYDKFSITPQLKRVLGL